MSEAAPSWSIHQLLEAHEDAAGNKFPSYASRGGSHDSKIVITSQKRRLSVDDALAELALLHASIDKS